MLGVDIGLVSAALRRPRAASGLPSAFGSGDWTLASGAAPGQLLLTINTVPAGATAIDYSFDAGTSWHSFWWPTTGARYLPKLTPGAAQSVTLRTRNAAGSSAGNSKTATVCAVKGLTMATVSITPDHRYFAGTGITVDATTGVNRATAWNDQIGTAHLTCSASVAPRVLTDVFGRTYVVPDSKSLTAVGLTNAALTFDPRNITVVAVARCNQIDNTTAMVMTNTTGTAITALGCNGGGTTVSVGPKLIVNNSSSGSTIPAARKCHQGLMAVGACANSSLSNAYGSVNGLGPDTFGKSVSATTATGIGISQYQGWEIYDLLIYNRAMTAAQMTQVVADLTAAYGIIALANVAVLDGDSITYGKDDGVLSNPAAVLARENYLPADWMLLNCAHSGDTIENLITQRDTASTQWVQDTTLPAGRKVALIQIGRNNTTDDLATIEGKYASYVGDATSGLLARGWEFVGLGNIGVGTSVDADTKMAGVRAWLGTDTFLAAVGAATGQSYAGKVKYRDVSAAVDAGTTPLRTMVAGSVYTIDGTHPTTLGERLMAMGGDDATKGMLYDLV